MAEAWLNHFCTEKFEAHSAGLEPGQLNPLVIEAMKMAGIDISKNRTKSVLDYFKTGLLFSHVITVCDQASAEKCPVFPGVTQRLHWSFRDPSGLSGTVEEKLAETCRIRDEIRDKVFLFCKEN